MAAASYPIRPGVLQERQIEIPGTLQPNWQLGYPNRATPAAEHGLTNAGSAVTTAANKAGFVATAADPFPKTVAASGRVVIPVTGHNWMLIKPIFLAANNADLPLAVWAWRCIDNKGNNNDLDVQEWQVDCILHTLAKACAKTGISGGRIGTSWRYCDQFTSTVFRGFATTGFLSTQHPSAPDDAAAYFYFDIGGAQYIEVEGVINGETRWNFLYALI